MEEFPSQHELTAAAGLLLLPFAVFFENQNSETVFIDVPIEVASKCERSGDMRNKSMTSDSMSADSSWLTSDGSSGTVQARRMRITSAFTSKLKELRRRRSKIHRTYHVRRMSNLKKSMSFQNKNISETTSEASCISSSTSDLSSTLSRRKREEWSTAQAGEELKGRGAISSNIIHRAQAILNFLSRGCSSEVRIRQILGDSPDTSKALRILLKRAEIKRSGAGGRSDPYIYMVSTLSRGP